MMLLSFGTKLNLSHILICFVPFIRPVIIFQREMCTPDNECYFPLRRHENLKTKIVLVAQVFHVHFCSLPLSNCCSIG